VLGSGVTTLVEVLRVLLNSNFVPTKVIEFHFYSAEEIGLRGSQKVAQLYSDQDVDVLAMFQADMTGYTPPGKPPVIAVGSDYSDKAFSVIAIMTHF
jgi:leucyl aminopeptidase